MSAQEVHVQFMDEPTSGLDARSAATVMAAVRNVAGNGRTVMVTIHQPSIEIFESFDRLVLLGTGGHSVYIGALGPQSCQLVDYLQACTGSAWSACMSARAGAAASVTRVLLSVRTVQFDASLTAGFCRQCGCSCGATPWYTFRQQT